MESWFLVPRFERVLIRKDTTKFYTQKRISCGRTKPIVCTLARDGAMSQKIPVKRVRAKSVVLAEPLRKGELAMIGYERWAYGRVEERDGNISAFIEGYGD